MKKLFVLVMLSVMCSAQMFAQNAAEKEKPTEPVDTTVYPFMKDPNLPSFNILKLDSSGFFRTSAIPSGKPTAMILFNPDCGHCQLLISTLLKAMDKDSLTDIQFYLVTPNNLTELRKFYDKYHLQNYPNIKEVGRDQDFFFFNWFGVHFVPYLALYDKNKQLLKGFDKAITVKDIYALTHR